MNAQKHPKNFPVSSFIGVSLIIVFFLFNAQVITSIPCGKGIEDVFMSNFVHVDISHLLANLYALYALSRIEQEMGFQKFIMLLIYLLVFNTLAEFLARKIWKDMKCSIGFSGILFGMLTWELVAKKKFDMQLMLAIVLMVVGPSLQNKRASLSGHVVGAVSGIIGALIWKLLGNHPLKTTYKI